MSTKGKGRCRFFFLSFFPIASRGEKSKFFLLLLRRGFQRFYSLSRSDSKRERSARASGVAREQLEVEPRAGACTDEGGMGATAAIDRNSIFASLPLSLSLARSFSLFFLATP